MLKVGDTMDSKIKKLLDLNSLPGKMISLYQPTTRVGDQKDLLIYKNLLKSVEGLLVLTQQVMM
ncbi:MAG: hypothetical protein GX326_00245 [Clostridiaceae bacterium]|nr:hypothetical protein [Clostridiaceae bacterium]